jgi:hypothetical protein
MVHEKIFRIDAAREVKVIIKGFPSSDGEKVAKFFEIKIRESGQMQFTDRAGITLPVPSDVQKTDQKQLASELLAQIGICESHIQATVTEFDQILDSSVLW